MRYRDSLWNRHKDDWHCSAPNESVVWIRDYEKGTCLPYFRWGNEAFAIPIAKVDVYRADNDPTKTPYRDRGVLTEEGLYYA